MRSSVRHTIQPRQIRLEASTVCQLQCPSCPTALGKVRQSLGSGFLQFSDFRKIVDENPRLTRIELSNWGEIFLNPELVRIIRYAYQRNVDLRAGTGANLNTVSDETLEALVKYRFRMITCSIDGASQPTYSQYRRNGRFENVIRNIESINRLKRKYHSPYPVLKWQFVAFGHNEHEIGQARRMAEELGMTFWVKLSWEDLYGESFSPIRDREAIGRETGLGVASRREYREKYGRAYLDCCAALWTAPQVNYDGRLLGCSVNYWADYGNVFQEGLATCVNNEKIRGTREMLMGRRPMTEDMPCARCNVFKERAVRDDWVQEDDVRGEHVRGRACVMLENRILGPRASRQLSFVVGRMRRQCRKVKTLWNGDGGTARLKVVSGIYPLQVPLPVDPGRQWQPFPLFKGAARGVRELSCHASALVPSHRPHPPHRHPEEELLLLLSGEVDLILPEAADRQTGMRWGLTAGRFAYYPCGFPHTLEAKGAFPANYLMFKWHAHTHENGGGLEFGCHDMTPARTAPQTTRGFCAHGIVAGSTAYLGRLECHRSTLAPHTGYAPHTDGYDLAVIVLEGEVETLGQRATPCNVVFYAAGDPHGMYNPGETTAQYLVLEFHARQAPWRRSVASVFRSLLCIRRKARHAVSWLTRDSAQHVGRTVSSSSSGRESLASPRRHRRSRVASWPRTRRDR